MTSKNMDRTDKVLHDINLQEMKGLEIGALWTPIVSKEMSHQILYLDYLSTEELKKKCENAPWKNKIVEVDYVIREGQSLNQVLEKDMPFDYIIASHVIEHVPNPISWFNELYDLLKPGGILSLVIPDKRFCFDYLRQLSSVPELVDAYLMNREKPSPKAVFDYYRNIVSYQGQITWGQQINPDDLVNLYTDNKAFEMAKKASEGEYVEVHSWCFTSDNFLQIMDELKQLNLFKFQVNSYYPQSGCEFYVGLKKIGND
jgi:SAM-dependent methyltransferase